MKWLKEWLANRMSDNPNFQEPEKPAPNQPKTAKQWRSELDASKRKVRDLELEIKRLRQTAAMQRSVQHSSNDSLPWVPWEERTPFDDMAASNGDDMLLLMPSGKTTRACVKTTHRPTGGDMFSGDWSELVTPWGEKIGGTPTAWLYLRMPEFFWNPK